jgi:hypothetical protein
VASPVAITSPFRLLSAEGAAALREVALALRAARVTSGRTASYVPGGTYRSRFLRDLCNSPEIARHMSRIAGCELVAHSMPSQQAYINFAPDEVGKAVDTWHSDGIGYDYVLLLSDPAGFEGGEFQFFHGTKAEAAALLDTSVERLDQPNRQNLPEARRIALPFPAAGYAIFQQGSHVVHRATGLKRPGERITVVPGLVAPDAPVADPTRDIVAGWGEPTIEAEFARHKAWLARNGLERFIAEVDGRMDPAALAARLRAAIGEAERAVAVLEGLAKGKES